MKNFSLPSVQSKAQFDFSRTPQVRIPRSVFDRTHSHKTTFDAGYLIPIYVDEVLPGDSFKLNLTAFLRLATPIFPLMDNLHVETFFFAVPNRLLWTNWQKFCGEQINPGDSTDFTIPQVTVPGGGFGYSSLWDYMGMKPGIAGYLPNALHSRAYNLIYNQWFRDENLQNSLTVDQGNGPDTASNYVLQRRGKRKDYFTSCLPWPQKGVQVTIPLGTSAPVYGDGKTLGLTSTGANTAGIYSNGSSVVVPATSQYNQTLPFTPTGVGGLTSVSLGVVTKPNVSGIYADLTTAVAAPINTVRQAFQVQRILEKDARGGTRYPEILQGHFNVVSPDSRVQYAEYLGGGSAPVTITPIAQTSSTDATTPQGNLSAMGTCLVRGHGFVKSFVEHCVIVGLMSVRGDLTYQDGLNRMFRRRTRYDYYWPSLAHLGEQAVLNSEIYLQGTADDDLVFGYQERFAEYRYKPALVTGLFRSDAAGTLDSWHLSQDFSALPLLNSSFIVENPPMTRVKAVTTQPDFLADMFFDLKCARPMPVRSIPGYIDHF